MMNAPYPSADDIFSSLDEATAAAIAVQHGTPVYLISEDALRTRIRTMRAAVAAYPGGRIAWSFKTNPLLGILSIMRDEGLDVEVVSDFEYQAVREAGVPASDIVFNGPARSDEALADALRGGAVVNLDHREELERLIALGDAFGENAKIGFRMNTEGQRRFGFSLQRNELSDAVARVAEAPYLQFGGLHNHLGADIRDLDRFERLSACLAELAHRHGAPLGWIDVGGGLAGTNARPQETIRRHSWIHPQEYCAAVLPALVGAAHSLILEPGRSLIEPTGALLTRVVGVRTTPDGAAAYIVDGGVNAVSSALSRKLPVRALIDDRREVQAATLYGPLCMNKDKLVENLSLPALRRGDLVLVEGVGAYDIARGFAFIQPRPGVLLWRGATAASWLRRPECTAHIRRLEIDVEDTID